MLGAEDDVVPSFSRNTGARGGTTFAMPEEKRGAQENTDVSDTGDPPREGGGRKNPKYCGCRSYPKTQWYPYEPPRGQQGTTWRVWRCCGETGANFLVQTGVAIKTPRARMGGFFPGAAST